MKSIVRRVAGFWVMVSAVYVLSLWVWTFDTWLTWITAKYFSLDDGIMKLFIGLMPMWSLLTSILVFTLVFQYGFKLLFHSRIKKKEELK